MALGTIWKIVMTNPINKYYDKEATHSAVKQGRHRTWVGGLWEEIGLLQFNYLVASGLKPDMNMLDIGCGCFRAGIHLVNYLNPKKYHGIDVSGELMDVGYNEEIRPAGLHNKLPKKNLKETDEFNFEGLAKNYDFAIAQSVFTHLPSHNLKICLNNLARYMSAGGKFFVTAFIAEDNQWNKEIVHPPANIRTYPNKDPFHYSSQELLEAAERSEWDVSIIGDWGHPRAQSMIIYTKT